MLHDSQRGVYLDCAPSHGSRPRYPLCFLIKSTWPSKIFLGCNTKQSVIMTKKKKTYPPPLISDKCVWVHCTRGCVFMNISTQTAAADPGDEQMEGLAPLESCVTPQMKFSSAAAATGPLICGNGHRFPKLLAPNLLCRGDYCVCHTHQQQACWQSQYLHEHIRFLVYTLTVSSRRWSANGALPGQD